MFNVKESLLNSTGFVDNEFLDLYVRLVERNTRTPQRARITNKHHIVPKSWFNINKKVVDNSISNLVNLVYRDHVLAHYYLCLCTTGKLQYANELAFFCLLSRNNKLTIADKHLMHSLPLYNTIYESYKQKKHIHYDNYGDNW